MRRTLNALCFVLAICLANSPVCLAQQVEPSADWATIKGVPLGYEVIVKTKDGQSERGRISSVTDTALTLTRKNKDTAHERVNISEVYLVRRKAAKAKFALIGAGVGTAIGVGIGSAAKSDREGTIGEVLAGGTVPFFTGLSAGIGALAGTLVGESRRKRDLIYRSK